MKVIVAGSRSIASAPLVRQGIESLGLEITEVVSGAAEGADTLGELWAFRRRVPVTRFPAKWDDLTAPGSKPKRRRDGTLFNALAGHARNRAMAQYAAASGGALIVFWDGSSPGTRNMVSEAEKLGMTIYGFVVEGTSLRRFR